MAIQRNWCFQKKLKKKLELTAGGSSSRFSGGSITKQNKDGCIFIYLSTSGEYKIKYSKL